MKIIILDTETTGVAEADRICQLAYLILNEEGQVEEIHNELCTPPLAIGFESMAIHHITPEMLIGTPACVDTKAFSRLVELNTPDNLMVIQNAEFDLSCLEHCICFVFPVLNFFRISCFVLRICISVLWLRLLLGLAPQQRFGMLLQKVGQYTQ